MARTITSVFNNNGLTDTEILEKCPAIFAEQPHESRSAKYLFIQNSKILSAMRDAGFYPTSVVQAGSRSASKVDHGKVMIRFRKYDDLGVTNDFGTDKLASEILLYNSDDGSSLYRILCGIIRFACWNGLVDGDIASRLSLPHRGYEDLENIVQASYKIVEFGQNFLERAEEMKSVMLTKNEQLLFAEHALRFKYQHGEEDDANVVDSTLVETKPVLFTPLDVLQPQRYADQGDDLFHTYQRIQGNLAEPKKPGVRRARRRDKTGRVHTLRGVQSIDANLRLNTAISAFADELRKVHSK